MAIVDPSIIRGIRVWRGLHSHSVDENDGVLDYTLGGGIINVQSEIIRFVEELGLYPGTNTRHHSNTTNGSNLDFAPSSAPTVQPGIAPADAGPEEIGLSERVTWGSGNGRDAENAEAAVPQEDEGTRQIQRERLFQLEAEREVKRQI